MRRLLFDEKWTEVYNRKNVNDKDDIKTVIFNEQKYDVNNDPMVVLNIFNTFFINMGKKLAKNSNNYLSKIYTLYQDNELSLIVFLLKK
ncbi:hypothetical protein QTP88_022474 [Uroleucon formosanum]